MNTLQIVLGVIQLICGLFLIAVIILQPASRPGFGHITGGARPFSAKKGAD
jgi:preprotein translocase subunit SecG